MAPMHSTLVGIVGRGVRGMFPVTWLTVTFGVVGRVLNGDRVESSVLIGLYAQDVSCLTYK